jgi:hypothetical protein|tara:strand:- start:2328 stop:2504 length:177 start_codon:yes stop_codon:yes gene_type:complete
VCEEPFTFTLIDVVPERPDRDVFGRSPFTWIVYTSTEKIPDHTPFTYNFVEHGGCCCE